MAVAGGVLRNGTDGEHEGCDRQIDVTLVVDSMSFSLTCKHLTMK